MMWIALILAVLVVMAVIAAGTRTGKKQDREVKAAEDVKADKGPIAYKRKTSIFPNKEAVKMFERLCEALPGHHIHAEVGMQALMTATGRNHQSGKGRISQSRIDFVVTKPNGEIVCAVELDGTSHDNEEGAAKDARRDEAFEIAGIKLVRVRAERIPKGDELRALVL